MVIHMQHYPSEAERGKKAQLACGFDAALQNELTMDENAALVRNS